MTGKLTVLAVVALALAPAVFAGWEYTSVTHGDAGQNSRMMDITVRAWVDGGKARINFVESGNPLLKPGTYLLTKDSGKTVYLVDPDAKTYAVWDMEGMVGAAGSAMKMMGMKFVNPKVETLGKENGGPVAGLSSQHYRLRTSYTMEMNLFGVQQSTATVRNDELWTTAELKDPGLALWLNRRDMKTGSEELDAMIKAQMNQVEGFPLKRVSVTTSTDNKGQERVTKMTSEVTEIKTASPDPALFEIPAGYQEEAALEPASGSGKNGAASKGGTGPDNAALLKMLQQLKQKPQ